jgi:hypothetical protein
MIMKFSLHVFHTRLASVLCGQIAANLLHIARVAMLNSNRLRKINISEAIAELDKAKDLLHSSTRFALFYGKVLAQTVLI